MSRPKIPARYILTIAVCLTLFFASVIALPVYVEKWQSKPLVRVIVHKAGETVVFHINDVSITNAYTSHNVKCLIGDRYERNILGMENVTLINATKWMSLGNATPSSSLTMLTTEATAGNFSRRLSHVIAAWMNGTHRAVNFTAEWTCTSALYTVQSVGEHWNPTSNTDDNMYACAYLTDGIYHQFTLGSKAIVIWSNTYQ